MLSLIVMTMLVQEYAPANPEWNKPVEPFRIEANLYYVGANDVSAYLLTSPKGHVLLDSGFRETVPQIVANVKKLGFRMADIKYLIVSQAHYDHTAGIAELKRLTKAKLLASEEDARLLARGGRGDFAFQDQLQYEPVQADTIIQDGQSLDLNGIQLKAFITPGHTKGCTTWATRTGNHNAVFVCGVTAPGYRLKQNKSYPTIVADFNKTFDTLEKMPCDLLLTAHASQCNLHEKRKKNDFVNPNELGEFIRKARADFNAQLAKER